ncbi:MAG: PAS domain-containing protein [Ferrovibrio sp.]
MTASQRQHPPLQQHQSPRNLEADYGSAGGGAERLLSDDSRKLLAAWKSWRGTRLLPHRRDMDLVSIARLMPRLAILEVFSPQRMIFRLAGTDIETFTGQRLSGRNHIALAEPDFRASRGEFLWAAATQPCGAVALHGFMHPESGQPHQTESLALPILPDNAHDDPRAPIQLICLASRLPMLETGQHVTATLERVAATRHFIDIGAGIPA